MSVVEARPWMLARIINTARQYLALKTVQQQDKSCQVLRWSTVISMLTVITAEKCLPKNGGEQESQAAVMTVTNK